MAVTDGSAGAAGPLHGLRDPLEGELGPETVLHVDLALGDPPQGLAEGRQPRLGLRRHGALQPQVLAERRPQRDLGVPVPLRQAEEADDAPVGRELDGLVAQHVVPHGLDDEVGAAAPGDLGHDRGEILLRHPHGDGAQPAGDLEPARVQVGGDDVREAQSAGLLHEEQPGGPRAHHHARVRPAGRRLHGPELAHGVEARAVLLGHHEPPQLQGVVRVRAGGQLHDVQVVQQLEFREAPAHLALGDRQHQGALRDALRAGLDHYPDPFVAGVAGAARALRVEQAVEGRVQVGSADRGVQHAHHQLTGFPGVRIGPVGDRDGARGGDVGCSHARLLGSGAPGAGG